MKTILLITSALLCSAAPILTCSGSCTQTADGYSMDLVFAPERTAVLVSSVTLSSIQLYIDTYPMGLGTGFKIAGDGLVAYESGVGVPVQEWITLSGEGFTKMVFSTHAAQDGHIKEFLTLVVGEAREVPSGKVPEPGAWLLGVAGLVGVWVRRRMA